MEHEKVVRGNCYQFTNGKQCQVIEIPLDFDTGEEMVVYKENEDKGKVYVRPLSSFVAEIKQVSSEDINLIEEFLDLDENDQKLHFLQKHKRDITEKFISIVAQSMDFVEKETSLEMRYQDILHFINIKMKYESGRFL